MAEPFALHHVVTGPPEAPAVVLSGALGSTTAMWQPQLAALTERFRVIRVDHRGHGGSPEPDPPYRMADLAADALSLLDELGLDRVAWCGLSLGGMVGMYLASEAPQRLSRLVLSCTTAAFPDPQPWRDRAAAVQTGGTASIADSVVARWFTPGYAAAHPDVVAQCRTAVADTSDTGYIGCCQAIEVWDHTARLREITAPTLVIGGQHDPSIPVEPHLRTVAMAIPGAALEILDAAHLVNVEQAQRFNELLVAHLS